MLRNFYKIFIIPYTLFLLYLMFFGFGRKLFDDNIVRLTPIISTARFVEYCIETERYKNLIINIFGNIGMFIPFGFLGWVFPKFQNFKTLIYSFLSVLIIVEALQYFTRLGVFDVDDVLLNAVGVWVGFMLKKILDS